MRWADSASLAGGGGGQSSGGEGILDSSISVSSISRRKRKKSSRHASFYPTESSEVAALRQRVAQLEQHAEEHRRSERRWAAELLGLQTATIEGRNSDQQDRMRELTEMRAFFLDLLGKMACDTGRATDIATMSARLDATVAQLHQRQTRFEQVVMRQQQHTAPSQKTSPVAQHGDQSSCTAVEQQTPSRHCNENATMSHNEGNGASSHNDVDTATDHGMQRERLHSESGAPTATMILKNPTLPLRMEEDNEHVGVPSVDDGRVQTTVCEQQGQQQQDPQQQQEQQQDRQDQVGDELSPVAPLTPFPMTDT
jgi:hypothetical protein